MKKKIIVLGTALTLTLVATGATFASSPMSDYVKSFKGASQEQGTFEKINNQEVYKKEWGQYVASRELMASMNQQAEPSVEAMKHDLNINKVLYQEAEKRHLIISDDAALKFAAETRENIKNSSNAGQIQEMIAKVEESLGVTDDQYWKEIAPAQYKVGLSIGKVRDAVKHDLMTKNADYTAAELDVAVDQFAENLLLQATIQ